MSGNKAFSRDLLRLDAENEVGRICEYLHDALARQLKRRGIIVALSGGIDSSVTAALAVRAVGPERVLAIMMPERHSAEETLPLSNLLADHLGIERVDEDITGILEACGFYRRYDEAVRMVITEYGEGWKSKIVTPNVTEHKGFNLFSIVARDPDGNEVKKRLPLQAYLGIVAATNFKQRTRKMLEYYHADRMNYAVAGTPNRLEYDQGFFVKNGDGAADVKPIAHLYKTQVYQLAEHLGIPGEIRSRPPSTDTYSLDQGQDEFYFSLQYDKMDLCMFGKNNGYSAEAVAPFVELSAEQVERVYRDIDTKRATTRYLQLPPLLVSEIPEIVVHS
jgi:NAD+ synthase